MNKLDFSNTTLVMIDGTGTSFDENEKIINQMSKICNFFSIKHFTVSKTNSNIPETKPIKKQPNKFTVRVPIGKIV